MAQQRDFHNAQDSNVFLIPHPESGAFRVPDPWTSVVLLAHELHKQYFRPLLNGSDQNHVLRHRDEVMGENKRL